jgi:beta-glucosidase
VPVRLADTSSYLDFPGGHGHVRYGEGIFVGYRWYDARDVAVDHPFGHGLSYTHFDYTDLEVDVRDADDPIALTAALTVANTGGRDGAEVVQLYVCDRTGLLQVPPQELRAFTKVRIAAGASQGVRLDVLRRDLEHAHPDAGWIFAGGRLDVVVGSSSRDLRLRASVEVPGRGYRPTLTTWSSLREWLAHPVAGPAVQRLLDARGGVRGRMGDLLGDPVSRDSVLSNPLASLTQFPGFPLTEADTDAILAGLTGVEAS